jgi:general secretion pathway protein A
MYNSFYGFDVDPFRVNPDPRFLYFSESHREALATLVYAVRERKGFIVLTGEVGTGKTTVVNALVQKLERNVQSAYLFNTALSLEDFFAYLFEELGLEHVTPFQKATALHRLNHYLIERLRKGHQTLLLIDEAQNLSPELLEEVRMLSNLETPQSKLLQIVLIGQPELADALAQPALRQLRQRIELRHTIRALTPRETAEYVRERLLIAGHETGDVFPSSALKAIAKYTGGIPRSINVLCDNALLIGFAKESLRVSAGMVQEAALDMGLIQPTSPQVNGQTEPVSRPGFFRRLWPFRRSMTEVGLRAAE